MDIETHIRRGFALQSMMTTIGAELTSVGEGTVEIAAPLSPGFLQHNGFGHAGLTFTLGDTAAGCAAMTLLGTDQAVVTSEIGIHLLSPAIGDSLVARGKVIKPGRRQIVSSSDVFVVKDGVEKHIATLTGTMVPIALD
ncbi:PaaI family thioesterase [Tropicibacter sp. R15_0]|uniref:PaaI family thioesterase n=1 Tax=Tropicibacter sp. R15_0 TaxID=2821101 RepID=UPI001ADC6D97|nr:PaaI family thioesterase [Tropicibacter sp. R15_0]MBO9465699.1 PaaI family thioesterase [Tropicibacter sp. R15_0]